MSTVIHIKIPDSYFGFDAINNLAEIATRFSAQKILIATDAGIVKAGVIDRITEHLKMTKRHFDIYADCEPEPSFKSVELLCNEIRNGKYDLIVGVGGGSVMDATKVASQLAPNNRITLRDLLSEKTAVKAVTKVLIPTTAGTGSEWSNVAIVYDDETKNSGDSARVYISDCNFADAVIIDPSLVIDLPQKITADTGMDALTHAIEAFISPMSNEISDMFAVKAIELISSNLLLAFSQGGNNPEARYKMSIAASMAMGAAVMSSLGMAHFASEPLGEKLKLSHGAICTLMLPHVMQFNSFANPTKFVKIAQIMGENINSLSVTEASAKAIEAVRRLAADIGMRLDLKDIDYTDSEIESMARSVYSRNSHIIKLTSSRDVTPEDIKAMYMAIIKGTIKTN